MPGQKKVLRLKISEYGFDRELMAACIIEAEQHYSQCTPVQRATIVVRMYEKMVDLVNKNGGEMEAPHDLTWH